MISLKQQVHNAISGVCAQVVYGYPRSFTGSEMIFWRESANHLHAQADGDEYLAELNYALEVFAPGAEAANALMEAADACLQAAGFRREACAEQFEQNLGVSHVSARYRALADADGNIYQ